MLKAFLFVPLMSLGLGLFGIIQPVGAQATQAGSSSSLQNQAASSVQGTSSGLQNGSTQTTQGSSSLDQLTQGPANIPLAAASASTTSATTQTKDGGVSFVTILLIVLGVLGASIFAIIVWGALEKPKTPDPVTEPPKTPKKKKPKTGKKKKKAHR